MSVVGPVPLQYVVIHLKLHNPNTNQDTEPLN